MENLNILFWNTSCSNYLLCFNTFEQKARWMKNQLKIKPENNMKLTQRMLDAFRGGQMESHMLSGDKYAGNRRTNFWGGIILSAIMTDMGELWISLEDPEKSTDSEQPWKKAPELMNFCTLTELYRVNNIGSGFGEDEDSIQLYSVTTGEVIVLHPPAENPDICVLWLILEDEVDPYRLVTVA